MDDSVAMNDGTDWQNGWSCLCGEHKTVIVEPRTGPGMNRQGGVGRVVRKNAAGTFDVRMLLGGWDKGVEAHFLSCNDERTEKRQGKQRDFYAPLLDPRKRTRGTEQNETADESPTVTAPPRRKSMRPSASEPLAAAEVAEQSPSPVTAPKPSPILPSKVASEPAKPAAALSPESPAAVAPAPEPAKPKPKPKASPAPSVATKDPTAKQPAVASKPPSKRTSISSVTQPRRSVQPHPVVVDENDMNMNRLSLSSPTKLKPKPKAANTPKPLRPVEQPRKELKETSPIPSHKPAPSPVPSESPLGSKSTADARSDAFISLLSNVLRGVEIRLPLSRVRQLAHGYTNSEVDGYLSQLNDEGRICLSGEWIYVV